MTHFGRSGTGLLHSLIDGHPNVSTLPSVYFSQYFDSSTWQKIISHGWDEMANQFTQTYDVLFNAASATPVETKGKKLIHNIGKKEGMTNLGYKKNDMLFVDKAFL